LRFRTAVSFAFPTSDLAAFALDPEQQGRATLRVKFMGVATPASFGSLPTPYAEDVAMADRDRLPALHEFLDLFNHRFIALFYRAWQKHRAAVTFESTPDGQAALFEMALRSLLGLATEGARAQVPLPDGLCSAAPACCGPARRAAPRWSSWSGRSSGSARASSSSSRAGSRWRRRIARGWAAAPAGWATT
jgi:predicted component of type VI protein secretion system